MIKRSQQISLPGGRKLGFDEYGSPGGKPVFYIHGTPSSRVEFSLFADENLLAALGLRVIAIDRPGMGLSDYQSNRRFRNLPEDLSALADTLKIARFSVLAYSGGGPYGAACARVIPDRLASVGIVSGAAPFDQPGLADGIPPGNRQFMDLSYKKPWLSRLTITMMVGMTRLAPGKVVANAMAALPQPDREMVALPEFQTGFMMMIQEAARKGPRGAQHDTRLMVTPWDFKPQDIQIPVYLWHGEQDQNAPVAMGRYMTGAIPNSRATFYPGEGHLSLFKKHFTEIIQALAASSDRQPDP